MVGAAHTQLNHTGLEITAGHTEENGNDLLVITVIFSKQYFIPSL